MKKLIYISGPISGTSVHQIYANLRRFFRWEARLLQHGFAPVNPAADFFALMMMGEEKDEEAWYARLLGKDEPIVKRADALFMLNGWQNSKGAQKEWEWAREAGVPITTSLADLEALFPDEE